MKPWLKSYLHYSALERVGVIALAICSLLLILSFYFMPLFVNSEESLKDDTQLVAAWTTYKQNHIDAAATSNEYHNTIAIKLFPFDPNTLDSNGYLQLGLKPKTVHLLLNWRRKGKVFYQKEEFSKLYTLSEEQYKQLEPYIIIASNDHNSSYEKKNFPNTPSIPDHININTADSATLVCLKGIGPFYAHKLIEKRNALGGYITFEQLKEAYHFPDTTFAMLQEKIIIEPNAIHKININSVDIETLKDHPYIREKMAKNIILYRDAIKQFEKMEQLRQVPLMNEEIYRKIAPYLTLE